MGRSWFPWFDAGEKKQQYKAAAENPNQSDRDYVLHMVNLMGQSRVYQEIQEHQMENVFKNFPKEDEDFPKWEDDLSDADAAEIVQALKASFPEWALKTKDIQTNFKYEITLQAYINILFHLRYEIHYNREILFINEL